MLRRLCTNPRSLWAKRLPLEHDMVETPRIQSDMDSSSNSDHVAISLETPMHLSSKRQGSAALESEVKSLRGPLTTTASMRPDAPSLLLPFSNRFRNPRTEELYQMDVSQQAIGQSQFILALVFGSHLVFSVWWTCASPRLTPSGLVNYDGYYKGLHGLEYLASEDLLVVHFMYFPFALGLALIPFRLLNSWGKSKLLMYWARRYWKHCMTLVVTLYCTGKLIYLGTVFQRSQTERNAWSQHQTCGRNVPAPAYWVDNNGSTTLAAWRLEYIDMLNEYISIIFACNAVADTILFSLSLKLDFPQVILVLLSAALVYVINWKINAGSYEIFMSMNFVAFVFAICLPIVLTLVAFYLLDRAARYTFYSKMDAERVNTALKHGVTVNRQQLATRGRVGPIEQQLLQELLHAKSPENEFLHNVSIPFEELTLHELVSEHVKGDVVRGEYTGLRVAIKRLSVLTRETIVEFKAHVELLAGLRHPNVVQFIGASIDSISNLCIVLEYMEKGDVHSLLQSSMTLEWNDPLLQIANDAAQGMAYLHHSNIIHRDLKSANLLCSATYACKVSDFGESKQIHMEECLRTMVGTPYWLAPEILRETPYSTPVDCYSFGIVLIELESRKDPYFDCDGMSTIDIMAQVARGVRRPTIPSTCPPKRHALISRCLDDDPKARPSMVEILKALQTDIREEVLSSRINTFDAHINRRQLLLKHQMLNRCALHEIFNDGDASSKAST
ncbi:TKL/DRK protein kinase [Saprolegnia diclina VS20]|uniref:TKL/DRK protein kinase n=1 Tax=Saprolegnia diclina (strain VS20) TaxID=1156394 RepID=T0QEH3_SAPDV|nr:TKL/DRK protein kinase [Saprolegnia diclina VS20]EQC33146.1 TKL/DRK protein kinase [Saprolegnia diclina VS20]|eukprot:XP_008613269.1 TKL/DRK protein kinase [Saprolegnia diclina VS20]